MYAEYNICADAREKMSKYSVVLVQNSNSNDLQGQQNIFVENQGQPIYFTPITFCILVTQFFLKFDLDLKIKKVFLKMYGKQYLSWRKRGIV